MYMQRTLLVALALLFSLGLATPRADAAFTSDAIAKAVNVFFNHAPVMVDIARCESGLRQNDASGRVLRGGFGGHMIGLFQLNEQYHRSAARALGFDIDSLLGNIAYARELYRTEGTTPWNSSSGCWQPTAPATSLPDATQAAGTARLSKTLRYGTRDPEVDVLRSALARAGFSNVSEGDYFGIDAYKLVSAFQCANHLACYSTLTDVTHVGVVDEATRKVLNSYLEFAS
jgi:hypothetical protein